MPYAGCAGNRGRRSSRPAAVIGDGETTCRARGRGPAPPATGEGGSDDRPHRPVRPRDDRARSDGGRTDRGRQRDQAEVVVTRARPGAGPHRARSEAAFTVTREETS